MHSIYLVDDHVIVRNGLKELIENIGEYKVTGEFNNGKELLDNIPAIAPALIIMDISMPVMSGAEAMAWLKENGYDLPVLILTLDTTDKTIIELYRSGVRGYLPKTCTAQVLKKAIDDIIDTGYYHNELLSNAMQQQAAKPAKDERQAILDRFSERELQFLNLVCDREEYTYEQIADIMHVHRRTVDGYREALFEKFKIRSKTGLVLFAIKHGLIIL